MRQRADFAGQQFMSAAGQAAPAGAIRHRCGSAHPPGYDRSIAPRTWAVHASASPRSSYAPPPPTGPGRRRLPCGAFRRSDDPAGMSISRRRPTIRRRAGLSQAMRHPARATCRLTRSIRNSTARSSTIAAKKSRAPIVIDTPNKFLYLVEGRRQGAALRHRRRPSGLHLGRREDDHRQARMAGLAAAGRHAAAAARSAALYARRHR